MSRVSTLASHFLRHRFRSLHPFEVQATLLNACNLRCSYCRCPDIATTLLTTEEWETTIRALAVHGTFRLKFQGGEPTIRSDFRQLCRCARAAGLVTAVTTNGVRIAEDPSLLDELDEVVVSVDAVDPALHDRNRGTGSHAAALAAVRSARARGLRTCINMVVTRESRDQVEPMLAFCEREKVELHVQPVMHGNYYQSSKAQYLALGIEGESELHLQLAALRRAGRPLLFSAKSYERSARWGGAAHVARRGNRLSSCMAGRFYVHIEPNGDVHPCGMHAASFTPKNVVRDGLEAALAQARIHDCVDCCFSYLNERKALFGLRPHAIREVLSRKS